MKHAVEKKTYPFSRTFSTAAQSYSERRVAHLTIWSGQTYGCGEASPLQGWVDETLEEVVEELEDLIARLPLTIQPIDLLSESIGKDLCCSAKFALHSALFDLLAKEKNTPIWMAIREFFAPQYPKLFSTLERPSALLVNATLSATDMDELEAATKLVAQGFRCLKVKVGGRDLKEDVQRVRRLRAEFPDIALRLDANQSWDKVSALKALEALEGFDIEYIEEPLVKQERWEPGELANFRTEVAADESLSRVRDVEACLEQGIRVFVVKPAQFGGFDTLFETASLLKAKGTKLVITASLDSLGRFFAAEVAYALGLESPCGLATGAWLEDGLEDPLLATPEGMCWQVSS